MAADICQHFHVLKESRSNAGLWGASGKHYFHYTLIPSSFCLTDYAHHDSFMTSHEYKGFIRIGLVYHDGNSDVGGMADRLVRASRLFRSLITTACGVEGWHWWPTRTEEGHTWLFTTGSMVVI
jgi:hypothetical protein